MNIQDYKDKAAAFFTEFSDMFQKDKKFTPEMVERADLIGDFFLSQLPKGTYKGGGVGLNEGQFGYTVYVLESKYQNTIIQSLLERNFITEDQKGYKFLNIANINFRQTNGVRFC